MKESLIHISPQFDCRRMVLEYMTELYEPAHAAQMRLRASGFDHVREKTRWTASIREVWDRVRFLEAGNPPLAATTSGKPLSVKAAIDLAGLKPSDVRVELVIGRVNSGGTLEETEVVVLPPVDNQGNVAVFARDVVPERTGRLGYALRVSPNHFDDPLTRPCTSLLKWSPVA